MTSANRRPSGNRRRRWPSVAIDSWSCASAGGPSVRPCDQRSRFHQGTPPPPSWAAKFSVEHVFLPGLRYGLSSRVPHRDGFKYPEMFAELDLYLVCRATSVAIIRRAESWISPMVPALWERRPGRDASIEGHLSRPRIPTRSVEGMMAFFQGTLEPGPSAFPCGPLAFADGRNEGLDGSRPWIE